MHTLAGNSKGLLLPNSTTDQEMLHIRNSLPEKIVVQVTPFHLQPLLHQALTLFMFVVSES